MWALTVPWWELILRVVLVYAGLMALVRIAGKREIGELTPMDLLTTLIISEIVSPALTAGEESIPGALLGAATLFGLTLLIARISYQWPRAERMLQGAPEVLIHNGRVDERRMRRERITQQDLDLALRQEGLTSVQQVRLGVVEPTGQITIIRTED